MKKIIGVIGATLFAISGIAKADVYDWSYTDGGTHIGSGTFVTGTTGNPYQVVDVTGIADGFTITGLSLYAGADNLFYDPATANPGFVDFGGISFTTASGPDFNIGGNGTVGQYVLNDSSVNPNGFANVTGSYNVDFTAAVPEPATIALFGLGMLGVAVSRRKSNQPG